MPLDSVLRRTVASPKGGQFLMPQRDGREIIDTAVEEIHQTLTALRIPVAALRLEQQAEQARQVLENAAPATIVCDTVGLDAAIRAAAASLDTTAFDAGSCIQNLLDSTTVSGAFERALFALMSEDGHSIRGRLASGPGSAALVESFQFSVDRSDAVLHAAIERKQD